MVRLSMEGRRNLLLIPTGLVVCYVRYIVQYGHRPWASGLLSFLASWLVHYFAVAIVCFLVLAIFIKTDPFFFPGRSERTMNARVHETIVQVCITLFAVAVFVWSCISGQGAATHMNKTLILVLVLALVWAIPALAGPAMRCQTHHEPTLKRLQTLCDDGTRAVSTWGPTLQQWQTTITPEAGKTCTGRLNPPPTISHSSRPAPCSTTSWYTYEASTPEHR